MPKARLYGPPTGRRVQGSLTKDGTRAFERVRKEMAQSTGLDAPSDADVIEFLARSWTDARKTQ